jgi:hypothetical protein
MVNEPTQQEMPSVVDDDLVGENHGGENELVTALSGLVDIDNDNEPVPENVPILGETESPTVLATEWGHSGFCYRKQNNLSNAAPKLCNSVDTMRNDINLQLFERFFPRTYMIEVIIKETNKKLKHPLTYGELLRWLGLWILMSTVDGSDRRSFWSSRPINIYEGAPFWLTEFMSRTRFEQILNAISYTTNKPPEQLDQFWEVHQ